MVKILSPEKSKIYFDRDYVLRCWTKAKRLFAKLRGIPEINNLPIALTIHCIHSDKTRYQAGLQLNDNQIYDQIMINFYYITSRIALETTLIHELVHYLQWLTDETAFHPSKYNPYISDLAQYYAQTVEAEAESLACIITGYSSHFRYIQNYYHQLVNVL